MMVVSSQASKGETHLLRMLPNMEKTEATASTKRWPAPRAFEYKDSTSRLELLRFAVRRRRTLCAAREMCMATLVQVACAAVATREETVLEDEKGRGWP